MVLIFILYLWLGDRRIRHTIVRFAVITSTKAIRHSNAIYSDCIVVEGSGIFAYKLTESLLRVLRAGFA